MERKNRNRKGFTLAEVLVVVVIGAILLALGVPAIIGGFRSMRLSELDESARSIFLAAQNRMTAMVGNGEMADDTPDSYTLADFTDKSEKLPGSAAPSDFPKIKGTEELDPAHGDPDDLRYLNSNDPNHKDALAKLLPAGSIETELADHHYVVEYNCKTGAVYGVWYFEDEFDYVVAKGEPRDRGERLKNSPLVGYYGGSGVDYAKVGQMPVPQVTLTNAEELRLTVTMPSTTISNIKVDVTMTGVTSGATVKIIDGASLGAATGTVMLDTLKDYPAPTSGMSWSGTTCGKAFKNWTADDPSTSFIPGEDITVTVRVYYAGTGGLTEADSYLPREVTVSGNSLFASVSPDGTTANIAYGRHLQNLDSAISGVTKVTDAVQVQEIDFNAKAADHIYSWNDTYTTATPTKVDFISIYNSALKSYDGRSLPIRNMDAVANETFCAGLFASIENATLKNIVLIDAKAQAGGSYLANVGALAGAAGNNVTVENCQVYLDKAGKVINPDPMLVARGAWSYQVHVGGLIGCVSGTDTKITNSFASTVVSGKDNPSTVNSGSAGGLVGGVLDSVSLKIEKSYAACYVTGGDHVGGLVGSGTVDIKNSYAAGIIASVNNSGHAGGLVGSGTADIDNSYAAVRYGKDFPTGVTVYGATPDSAGMTNVYYVRQTGVKYVDGSGTALTGKQLSEMTAPGLNDDYWYQLPAEKDGTANPVYAAFPYNQTEETKLLSTPYPYPMLSGPMFHYGDWLEDDGGILVYLEQYDVEGKPVYGIWGYLGEDGVLTNTLLKGAPDPNDPENLEYAVADGYGFLVEAGSECPGDIPTNDGGTLVPVTGTGDEPVMIEDVYTAASGTETVTYDFYLYKYEGPASYYHSITLSGQEYWFNLDYACEIVEAVEGGDSTKPQAKKGAAGEEDDTEYSQVVIRTARQLANLAAATGSTLNAVTNTEAQTRAYVQLLDIDYAQYENLYGSVVTGKAADDNAQKPAALNTNGHYDGRGFIIKNLFINGVPGWPGVAGLFGQLQGARVESVTLVDVTVNGGGCDYVGALAGEVRSGTSITNCGVYASSAETYEKTGVKNGGMYVGGLIGRITSEATHTLENCFAAVKVSGADNAGGLIGQINASTTLNNCYSGGHTVDGSYNPTDPNVTGTGNVGGLIGDVSGVYSGSTVTLNGVNYSTCSVGLTDAAGNLGKLIGNITNGTATKSSADSVCYALGKAFNQAGEEIKPRKEDYLTDDLKDVIKTDGVTAYPYDETLFAVDAEGNPDLTNPKPYPYLTGTVGSENLPHHGDWVEETPTALFYYEQYAPVGDYGVWGYLDQTDDTPVNTLQKGGVNAAVGSDKLYASEDGYCVAVAQNKPAPTDVTVDGKPCTLTKIETGHYVDSTTGTTYDLYKIKGLDDLGMDSYYHEIDLGGAKYWFNPFFACEIQPVPEETSTTPTAPTDPVAKPGAAGGNDTEKYEGEVVIRTARQLANLAAATGSSYDVNNDAQKRQYVQLLDIDYNQYELDGLTGKTDAKRQTPASLDTGGSYDGNEFVIRNLYLGGGTESAGLFGHTKGTLSHIRLVNVDVEGTNNVGALAGNFAGTAITNCGVYVDSKNAPAGITDAYGHFVVQGTNNYVGGLIGKANAGTTLNGCFAAVKVSGGNNGDNVGGLIGQVNAAVALTNCYSGGHTENGEYKQDSPNVSGKGNVGGLIGIVSGKVTFTGTNYSTCSVGLTSVDGNLGKLIGSAEANTVTAPTENNICYATGKAFNNGGETTPREETYLTTRLDQILAKDGKTVKPAVTATNTHPYDVPTLTGEEFPYKTNLGEHYGDWPEAKVTGMAYVEVEDNVVHYHLVGVDGVGNVLDDPAYNTLCTDHHVGDVFSDTYTGHISNTSYFATFEKGMGLFDLTTDSDLAQKTDEAMSNGLIAELESLFGRGVTVQLYGVASIKGGDERSVGVDNGYYIHYVSRYSNLGISSNSTTNMFGKADHPYEIRTAVQLDHLSGSNSVFNVKHDLYGMDHDGVGKSSDETLQNSTFNGGGYRILELDLQGGLFKNIFGTSTVSDVILYSYSGDATITSVNGYAGGLSPETLTTFTKINITNCVVAGYTIYGTNVGGLVGYVNDTLNITNCEAVNKLVIESRVGADSHAGGLVGNHAGGTLTIKDSYAGGSITGNITVNGSTVGGLYGGTATSNTVSKSYSYVDMRGVNATTGTTTFYGVGPGSTASNSYLKGRLPAGVTTVGDADSQAKSYNDLKTCITGGGKAVYNYHPDETLKDPYPFPAVVKVNLVSGVDTGVTSGYGANLVHYGDWPLPEVQVTGFLYWERENDGYHYTVKAWQKAETGTGWTELEVAPNPLCTDYDDRGIDDYGYAWFYAGDFSTDPTLTKSAGTDNGNPDADAKTALESALNTALKDALKSQNVETGNATVEAFSYEDATAAGSTQDWTITADSGQAAQVTLNTDFADTIGNTGTLYSVRTIRQLQNINNTAYLGSSFKQAHDLDGSKFTDTAGNPAFLPIGTGSSFTGTYDGQGYRILELDIRTSQKYAALFASVYDGTVQNVILYSPSGTAKITSNNNGPVNAAGIAGDLYGSAKVSNCAVAGYTITASNPGTGEATIQDIGGIAGWVGENAEITNCEAVVTLVNQRTTGGTTPSTGQYYGAFMGGIAGEVSNDGTVTITNCYSGGTIRDGSNTPHNAYIRAGGIVGMHQGNNDLDVINCYSYMNWDETGRNGNATKYPIVNTSNPYTVPQGSSHPVDLTNIYYLQDGSLANGDDSVTQSSDDFKEIVNAAPVGTFGNVSDAAHSYPTDDSGLTGQTYPYPAVVKVNGDYVHYGDWPATATGDPGVSEGPGMISLAPVSLVRAADPAPTAPKAADPAPTDPKGPATGPTESAEPVPSGQTTKPTEAEPAPTGPAAASVEPGGESLPQAAALPPESPKPEPTEDPRKSGPDPYSQGGGAE